MIRPTRKIGSADEIQAGTNTSDRLLLGDELGFKQEWAIFILRQSGRFRFDQNDQILYFEIMQHKESQGNPDVKGTSDKSRQALFHNLALEQNFELWQAGLRVFKQGIDIRNSRVESRNDRGNIRPRRNGSDIGVLDPITKR